MHLCDTPHSFDFSLVKKNTPKAYGRTERDTLKVKWQSTECEKTFAKHIPDLRLISKIFKELVQLSSKNKTKQPKQKVDK